MTINILRAISKMLESPHKDVNTLMVKVDCAKTMLDEVIKGMEPPVKPQPHANRLRDELDEPEYKMNVNPQTKALESIFENGVELDGAREVNVDGKIMSYATCKGMKFNQIKLVEGGDA